MNRKLIIALSLVVATAGLALLLMSRGDGDATAPAANARPSSPSASDPARRPQTPTPRPALGERIPSRPPSLSDSGERDNGPRTYVRDDGIVVRDHRGDSRGDLTGGIAVPRELAKVEPKAIRGVRDVVKPVFMECKQAISEADVEPQAQVQNEVVVSVENGVLSVVSAKLQTRGLTPSAVVELQDCLQTRLPGLQVDAAGHRDVDRYTLTIPFRMSGR